MAIYEPIVYVIIRKSFTFYTLIIAVPRGFDKNIQRKPQTPFHSKKQRDSNQEKINYSTVA